MRDLIKRVVNAVRGAGVSRPRVGVIAEPRERETWRSYAADGVTPQKMAAILHAGDGGDLSEQMALYEQMEEKDPHLFSVANTRRLAVTGLPWRIVSASEIDPDGTFDRGLADAAADHCRAALKAIDRFEEALQHLSLAVGRKIAVAELVWGLDEEGPRLADLVPGGFGGPALGKLDGGRIPTDGAPGGGAGRARGDGVALPGGKFIVHTPHAVSGHPTRGGLLRASALAYLGKQFALKDWLIFAEVFGMPVRIARYEPNATPEEKRELLDML